jgi:branched-chain amino acid transport system substrate-binding protein
MTKRSKVWTGVAVIIVGALLIWGLFAMNKKPQAPSAEQPIKVGFIGPLSGGPSLWGQGARNMVEIATKEINEDGGIDGRELQVTYEDGKCTSDGAVAAFQKLQQQNIDFIIGGHCSPETAGIVPLTKNGEAFLIAGITSSNDAVSGSDYAYRTSPPTRDFTDKLAAIAIEKYKNVGALTEQAAFSKSYTADFVPAFEAVGGTIVLNEGYQPEQTDFRTELLKMKNSKAEALFISPQSPTTAINIIKQMKELDINLPVFANSIAITKDVFAKAENPQALVGSFSIIPFTDKSTKAAEQLSGKYREAYGSDVPYNYFYVSAAYDAALMLAQALEECGEDVACVATQFAGMKYDGVSLDYTFKENGDSNFDSWAKISLDENGAEIVEPL